MSHSAILVFTARSPKKILEHGGSQAWALNRERARKCEFLVCSQNTQPSWGDATEPHGSAFLVGRISDLVPAPDDQDRWLIRISEYARITVPNAWQGWRNPVRYMPLEGLGIDPDGLNFEPVPKVMEKEGGQPADLPAKHSNGLVRPLTIAEAKQGLAAQFRISVDDIEIIIRG